MLCRLRFAAMPPLLCLQRDERRRASPRLPGRPPPPPRLMVTPEGHFGALRHARHGEERRRSERAAAQRARVVRAAACCCCLRLRGAERARYVARRRLRYARRAALIESFTAKIGACRAE